jgi:hypothetical protein
VDASDKVIVEIMSERRYGALLKTGGWVSR